MNKYAKIGKKLKKLLKNIKKISKLIKNKEDIEIMIEDNRVEAEVEIEIIEWVRKNQVKDKIWKK